MKTSQLFVIIIDIQNRFLGFKSKMNVSSLSFKTDSFAFAFLTAAQSQDILLHDER